MEPELIEAVKSVLQWAAGVVVATGIFIGVWYKATKILFVEPVTRSVDRLNDTLDKCLQKITSHETSIRLNDAAIVELDKKVSNVQQEIHVVREGQDRIFSAITESMCGRDGCSDRIPLRR